MTKNIRIENADTSDHKVAVFVEDQQADGTWVRQESPIALDYPTSLHTACIHSTRRLVIEEAPRE